MPIYDIFDHVEKEQAAAGGEEVESHRHISQMTIKQEREKPPAPKDKLFATIGARFFFLMLLIADVAWGIYSVFLLTLFGVLNLLTGLKVNRLLARLKKRWLSLKRSFICGNALFIALFSPALGTMFACTYFMMYDKKGIDEVVPSVLRDQFQEFFNA